MASVSFASVAPQDIIVEFPDGQELAAPGDIPIPDYIEIKQTLDRLLESPDDAESDSAALELYDLLTAVFRQRQPDLERLPIGPRMLVPVTLALLNPLNEEPEDEPAPDPTAPAGGTKTKPAGTKTKSRPKSGKSTSSS